jgi:hypothetical protein
MKRWVFLHSLLLLERTHGFAGEGWGNLSVLLGLLSTTIIFSLE